MNADATGRRAWLAWLSETSAHGSQLASAQADAPDRGAQKPMYFQHLDPSRCRSNPGWQRAVVVADTGCVQRQLLLRQPKKQSELLR
jgi:hypothetical protein